MRLVFAILLSCGLLAAQEFPIGSKISTISVDDHGTSAVINPATAKATAVIFVSVQCPVSNSYNDRMNALYRDYSGRGVQFAFVNANSNESVSDVDAHAQSKGFAFKVYKDVNNALADKFNAQATPEVFLFDQAGKLVYHGRIDNSMDLNEVRTQDARAALDAVLAGKPVPVANTKAFGCSIKRVKKVS